MTEDQPGQKSVSTAARLSIYDSTGKKCEFGDIFKEHKSIIVFIRHFFCGSCQAYVSQLSSVREDALKGAGVQIVLIGCGDYQPIKNYAELTGFKGAIYADPDRALFCHFNLASTLNRTPEGQQKKSYLAGRNFFWNTLTSTLRGLSSPHHIGKQGNLSQLGGEFIFGPGNQCTYASRMKHTEDHVEVSELMQQADVEYP